jgi:hypothetical protein
VGQRGTATCRRAGWMKPLRRPSRRLSPPTWAWPRRRRRPSRCSEPTYTAAAAAAAKWTPEVPRMPFAVRRRGKERRRPLLLPQSKGTSWLELELPRFCGHLGLAPFRWTRLSGILAPLTLRPRGKQPVDLHLAPPGAHQQLVRLPGGTAAGRGVSSMVLVQLGWTGCRPLPCGVSACRKSTRLTTTVSGWYAHSHRLTASGSGWRDV